MAEQIQVKLSTLKKIVESAEHIERTSTDLTENHIVLVNVKKTAFRQANQLEDPHEVTILAANVEPFEVVEG